ncbi:9321_t:CDS:2 [Funneliformis geosporum]|uniref:9321_t:CDS:1 n=1 Tax=Funneliformis geosporum TaxID=1117311 RepID=A0A9W4SLT5_9GLOM|nr:9321_t:CDS:2 [Funneliformis geosporum]
MKGDKQTQPNPSVFTPANPNSKWIISIPSTNQNNNSQNEIAELNWSTKDNIKEELRKRSLLYDEKENRQALITILRENIACEMINKIAVGWTLKENQEYEKKDGRKHISEEILELLKEFFMLVMPIKVNDILQKKCLIHYEKK